MNLHRTAPVALLVAALSGAALLPSVSGGQPRTGAPLVKQPAESAVQLTLPQARTAATRALRDGQPRLAYGLAAGLLQADPKSSFAHYVQANAQAMLGETRAARTSAARAYRVAQSKQNRFQSAELAARLAFKDNRPTLTQLWLRRAAHNAPNDRVEAQLARDYGTVRAINPLSFSLRGGLRPSSNVNNGADTAEQVIDGLPFVGTLSGGAQALSGIIGTVDGTLRYRLRGTKTSRTTLGARLVLRRVHLDSDAKTQAPDVSSSDFASTFAEVNLTHNRAHGSQGNAIIVGGALGTYWYGGDRSYDFARATAGYRWQLTDRTRTRLTASAERRDSAFDARFDSTALGLIAGLSHRRVNGDSLRFALNLRDTNGDHVNIKSRSATLSADYAFGKQMGPVRVSAGIAASYADYPDYVALFAVPGGRQDRSLYANLNLFFADMDYAGFAPSLSITAGRKFSNVSRFDTRELSVSLGIRSKF